MFTAHFRTAATPGTSSSAAPMSPGTSLEATSLESSVGLGVAELCPGGCPPSTSQAGRRRGRRAGTPVSPASRLQAALPSLSLPQPVDPKPGRFAFQSAHPSTDRTPEVPEDSVSSASGLAFWTLDVKTFLSQERLLCHPRAPVLDWFSPS